MLQQMLSTFKSMIHGAAFRTISAALFGGGIFYFLSRMGRNFGTKYILLCVGGILLVIILLLIVYLLWRNLQNQRASRMEGALGEAMKSKELQKEQIKAAIGSLRERWDQAVKTLKASGVNIYGLPWVLIIGEPQSGKTTTLRESGLDFPLGKDALSGSGGTVNCDWWFTNDGVIIDTAGRFTMPVDAAPDREEWRAFLKLLVRYRPKCPISSVVVTIPATSLLEDSPKVLEEKAQKIRDKLLELVAELGVEYPVYIMVSKSDLVGGFTEFCASLTSLENTQILGWNRPYVESHPYDPREFDGFFNAQAQRFHRWILRELRDKPVGEEADGIYSFYANIRGIKAPLSTYLSIIFKDDRFHAPLFWRGLFFSSGLQQGSAIISAIEGGEKKQFTSRVKGAFSSSRPYFVYHFYKKVFLENGLVKRVGKLSRREMRLRFAALAFGTLFSILAAVFLWRGYTSLSRVLTPLKERVETARTILTATTPGTPTMKAGDLVELVDAIEGGRIRMVEDGVALRFLKGRENSIVKDLRIIEDALLVKGLFRPIIWSANEKMTDIPKNFKDKDLLLALLSQNFHIIKGYPLSEISFDPTFDVLANKDPWFDIDGDTVDRLTSGFPRGEHAERVFDNPERLLFQTRRQLTSLHRFWKTYPASRWKELRGRLGTLHESYTALLATRQPWQEAPEPSKFVANSETFKKHGEILLSTAKEEGFLFPRQMATACRGDYEQLSGYISAGAGTKESEHLRRTVGRHSGICGLQENAVLSDRNRFLATFGFLLNEDGELNAEISEVLSALGQGLDFGPLFLETHQKSLLEDPGRLPGLLVAWGEDWKGQRDLKEKEILEHLSGIKAEGWQREQLEKVIGTRLDDVVWQAHQEAVTASVAAILDEKTGEVKRLAPGMDPPIAARTEWLESRFRLLTDIREWLHDKYPTHPGAAYVTGKMRSAMMGAYGDFVNVWERTIRSFDPAGPMLKTASWRTYRKKVLEKRGVFVDAGAWPLNLFIENITISRLNSLKKMIGKKRNKSIRSRERVLERTARVYGSSSGNLAGLSKAQDSFFKCVKSLSPSAVEAWQTVKGSRMEDFKTLSAFRLNVDIGPSSGERIAADLEKIETHGLTLLSRASNVELAGTFRNFIGRWRTRFENRYPFGTPGNSAQVEQTGKVRLEALSTVPSDAFRDYYFQAENGFDRIVERYNLRNELKKSVFSKRYQFVKNSLGWRDFLYDETGRLKIHTFKIYLNEDNTEVAERFTVLKLQGLLGEKNDDQLRLRFSGKSYKTAQGRWSLDAEEEISAVIMNEETRETRKLMISGGSLALPAYISHYGRRAGSSDRKKWIVEMLLPVDENGSPEPKALTIKITFEWDEDLPDRIPWPRR